jgi:hypothetical protein
VSAPPAYIGLSGVTTRAEVLAALAAFPACGRQLMVGVLASEKTLAGQRNRYFRRYPRVESIAGIFTDDPRCLNLVHFGADDPPDAATLAHLFEAAGPLCHGVQFNGAYPTPGDLVRIRVAFRRAGREARIVLQLRDLSTTMRQVWAYEGLITDVLIDASGGLGRPLDVPKAEALFEQLRSAFPHLGIGVAGGLFAETVPRVAGLLARGASCDAESGLRDGADGGGRLCVERVKAYLDAAAIAGERCAACDDPVPAGAKTLGWSYGTFVDGNAVWLCPDCKPLE